MLKVRIGIHNIENQCLNWGQYLFRGRKGRGESGPVRGGVGQPGSAIERSRRGLTQVVLKLFSTGTIMVADAEFKLVEVE